MAFDVNTITSTRTIGLAALVRGALVPTTRILHTSIFSVNRFVHTHIEGGGLHAFVGRYIAIVALCQLRTNTQAFERNIVAGLRSGFALACRASLIRGARSAATATTVVTAFLAPTVRRARRYALTGGIARLAPRARAARDAAAVIPTVFSGATADAVLHALAGGIARLGPRARAAATATAIIPACFIRALGLASAGLPTGELCADGVRAALIAGALIAGDFYVVVLLVGSYAATFSFPFVHKGLYTALFFTVDARSVGLTSAGPGFAGQVLTEARGG